MSAETIATYGPIVIAAVILVPVILFLGAMLFERALAMRWGSLRKATHRSIESLPLELPVRRATSVGAGGLSFGRVSAAPERHE